MLAAEISPSIPVVSKSPTLILGMDVSHGSPGQSDVPSIAAVYMIFTFSFLFISFTYSFCLNSYGRFQSFCFALSLRLKSEQKMSLSRFCSYMALS